MSILETDQILALMGVDRWVKKDLQPTVQHHHRPSTAVVDATPEMVTAPTVTVSTPKQTASPVVYPSYDSVTLLREADEPLCLWLISNTAQWLSYDPGVRAFLRGLIQTTIFPLPKIALGTLSLSAADIAPTTCSDALFEQFETLGVQKVITMTPLGINDPLIIQIPALDILASSPEARIEAARLLKEASILSVF